MATSASPVCYESADITFTVIYAALGVGLFVANLFACTVFLSHRRLRETYMNVFLVSLALSDILMAVLLVPGYATFCTGCSDTFVSLASPGVCHALDGLKDYVLLNSMFNVLTITYDRYVAVIRPLYYYQRMTRARVSFLLISIWVAPVPLAFVKPAFQELNISLLSGTNERIFDIVVISSCIIVPIFILIVVNAMIANAIRKQASRAVQPQGRNSITERKQRRERNGTRSCLIVMIISIICWLPRSMLNFFFCFGSSHINMDLLNKVSLVFLLLQSLLNPLVYSFYRSDFRRAAHNMRRRLTDYCLSHKMVQQLQVPVAVIEGEESTVC